MQEGFKEKVLSLHLEVQELLRQLPQQDFKEIQDKIALLETSINHIAQRNSITETKIKELITNSESKNRINNTTETSSPSSVSSTNNANSTYSQDNSQISKKDNGQSEDLLMDYDTLMKKKLDPSLDFKKLEVLSRFGSFVLSTFRFT
jgi:ribosomal protein L16 Arg81 hydroxylase